MSDLTHSEELSSLGSSYPVQVFSSTLRLKTLPIHIDSVFFSLVCFTALHSFLAEPVTMLFIPKQWAAFTDKQRGDWKLRVVSLAQSLLLGPASLYIIWLQKTRWEDRSLIQRVFEYYEPETQITNVAIGYFLWHFAMMVKEVDRHGVQMVAHAVIGVVFLGGVYYPFTSSMTAWFLVYEVTNIPHNIYKFLIPLGKGVSPLSIANAVVWIASFLFIRVIWGTYATCLYLSDLFALYSSSMTAQELGRDEWEIVQRLQKKGLEPSAVRLPVLVWCTACGIVLAGLNYLWFFLIVKTFIKKVSSRRVSSGEGQKTQ